MMGDSCRFWVPCSLLLTPSVDLMRVISAVRMIVACKSKLDLCRHVKNVHTFLSIFQFFMSRRYCTGSGVLSLVTEDDLFYTLDPGDDFFYTMDSKMSLISNQAYSSMKEKPFNLSITANYSSISNAIKVSLDYSSLPPDASRSTDHIA